MKTGWLISTWLLLSTLTVAQPPVGATEPRTILVIGFSPTQFNSNVYYIDELAKLNDTTQQQAVFLYNQALLAALVTANFPTHRFVAADSTDAQLIQANARYSEWKNAYKEPYLALSSDSIQDQRLRQLMEKYDADYLLAVNFYHLYRSSPPDYYVTTIKAQHILDYELFTSDLNTASAGQLSFSTKNSRAAGLQTKYQELAKQLLARLAIYEKNYPPELAEKKYLLLREQTVKNAWGGGLSVGWNATYGWIGAELTRYIGNRIDVNAGMGGGPNGFKAGAGVRYYLLGYGTRFKPFFGVHYAWASGGKVNFGAEEDDSGTVTNEAEVTTFRIPSGQALHLKVGFRWLKNNRAWLLHAGYAVPFDRYQAQLVESGSAVSNGTFRRRENWANLFTVGGLDAGVTYLVYFR